MLDPGALRTAAHEDAVSDFQSEGMESTPGSHAVADFKDIPDSSAAASILSVLASQISSAEQNLAAQHVIMLKTISSSLKEQKATAANGVHPKEQLDGESCSLKTVPAAKDKAMVCNELVMLQADGKCDEPYIPDTSNTSSSRVSTNELKEAFMVESGISDDHKPGHLSQACATPANKRHTVTQVEARQKRRVRVPRGVFLDAEAMKRKVREAISKPEYDVSIYYKDNGYAQSIARSQWFEQLTLAIIALNALWIAIDTDYNEADTLLDAGAIFQIGENLFCLYFLAEIVIRFLSFETKRNGLRDAWFVFDSLLVAMMVVETWLLNCIVWSIGGGEASVGADFGILRLVRLLRLTRMLRMVRLLRAMPELVILLKGILVAMRAVFFTMMLLMILIYCFAIGFTQLADGTDLEANFESVPRTMLTIGLAAMFPDLADLMDELEEVSIILALLMLAFCILTTLTVLNMLIGVLVDVVSIVSKVEKEQLTAQYVKYKLLLVLRDSGLVSEESEEDITLSKMDFEQLIVTKEGATCFQDVGVDVVGLVDLAEYVWGDEMRMRFSDFMDLILQLRGTNIATVKDIIDLRKMITTSLRDSLDKSTDRIVQVVKMQLSSPGSYRPPAPETAKPKSTPLPPNVRLAKPLRTQADESRPLLSLPGQLAVNHSITPEGENSEMA